MLGLVLVFNKKNYYKENLLGFDVSYGGFNLDDWALNGETVGILRELVLSVILLGRVFDVLKFENNFFELWESA